MGLVLTLGVLHRDRVRQDWTAGLALSALVALLLAPSQVVTVMHLDVFSVLGDMDVAEPVRDKAATSIGWALALGVVLSACIGLAWRTLLVPVAVAAAPERPPFPLITGHEGAVRGWWLAAPVGLGLGLGSAALGALVGVSESEVLQQQRAWLEGVDVRSAGYALGVALPYALGSALSEELLYRGVLQRWLTRGVGAVAAVGITSVVWAATRGGETDHFVVEQATRLVLGLALGGLAARYSVEAAFVAHGAFVVVVALAGLALGA